MFNQRDENGTYITSFKSERKQFDKKIQINNPKNLNSLDRIQSYKTIESSPFFHNKKLSSVNFPLIKQKNKNKKIISILFNSCRKSINRIQNRNLLNLSKIQERKHSKNKKNIFLQIKFNNSIDKINKKNNLKPINTSQKKKEKNKKSTIHNTKSAKTLKTLFINNLKFNQIKDKEKIKNISPKRSLDYLLNSSSSRNNRRNCKKKFKSVLDEFKKKEKLLEGSKKILYLYSLKSFSPRLLRKKGSKENNKIDTYLSKNNNNYNNEKYKIHTMIFKNKCIPYLDGIDIRKKSMNLPPINFGARYRNSKKSIEMIKRENLNDATNKEDEKITHRKKLNLTKKEILEKFRNRNLQFCNNRIQKTEEDANDKKNKIIKKFDNLKLSLNEFDNWNSPENAENLFE